MVSVEIENNYTMLFILLNGMARTSLGIIPPIDYLPRCILYNLYDISNIRAACKTI